MKRLVSIMAVIGAGLMSVAAAPNWGATVTQTQSGAMLLGNPAAKVRLVEYLSYSCSHCAAFVAESGVALRRDYVARGLVAVELRNAVRDRFDFTAALLARCGGPGRFFGNTDALMASQATWLGKASEVESANASQFQTLPVNDGLKIAMRGVGLDTIMKKRGLTTAQLDACLVSKPAQDRIIAMTNEAWNERKINGTPAFLINGTSYTGGSHWAQVEPALKQALAAR